MGQRIVQVDAFTDRRFAGNPAAVVALEEPAPEAWMRDVAMELNLSETAFLNPAADGYHLRWFTPRIEVDLCGHATLASAHVLWEDGLLPPDHPARFHTRSGVLTARRNGEWIELDFPAEFETICAAPMELTEALGVALLYVGKNRMDYLVEVESEAVLRGLDPDLRILEGLPMRGVIVTAPSDAPEHDFISRFFGPGAGVPEDPVTGSAHCCLGPFWASRLGKTSLVGYQASRRGGTVRVTVAGDRCLLAGQAVTVLRGELV